jgi:hypothetical protein
LTRSHCPLGATSATDGGVVEPVDCASGRRAPPARLRSVMSRDNGEPADDRPVAHDRHDLDLVPAQRSVRCSQPALAAQRRPEARIDAAAGEPLTGGLHVAQVSNRTTPMPGSAVSAASASSPLSAWWAWVVRKHSPHHRDRLTAGLSDHLSDGRAATEKGKMCK